MVNLSPTPPKPRVKAYVRNFGMTADHMLCWIMRPWILVELVCSIWRSLLLAILVSGSVGSSSAYCCLYSLSTYLDRSINLVIRCTC